LIRTPSGNQNFRGIPFELGPEGVNKKSWIALSSKRSSWATAQAEIPIGRTAAFFCLAQFCNWDENEMPAAGQDVMEKAGQHLADAAIVFEDGTRHVQPLRRRFEVGSLSYPWGH